MLLGHVEGASSGVVVSLDARVEFKHRKEAEAREERRREEAEARKARQGAKAADL